MTRSACTATVRTATVLCVVLAAAPALADSPPISPPTSPPDADATLPLLPLGSVHRPIPVEVEPGETPPKLRGCDIKALPALRDRLPFGPGETLSYDIALLGIRTGKVNIRVGERTVVDGIATYPVQAEARTDAFLSALGEFDAHMVSFFDPAALLPVRMVNRSVAHQPFVTAPIVAREDAAFSPARVGKDGPTGGTINGRVAISGSPPVERQAHLNTGADVVDILSVIYYLRSRELVEGTPFCFELFHRRRLWHVEGIVGGVDVVQAPIGMRRARRLDAVATRLGQYPPPPRKITAWIADDADRFPVLVSTPEAMGDVEVRLLSFERGRRLVAR